MSLELERLKISARSLVLDVGRRLVDTTTGGCGAEPIDFGRERVVGLVVSSLDVFN